MVTWRFQISEKFTSGTENYKQTILEEYNYICMRAPDPGLRRIDHRENIHVY